MTGAASETDEVPVPTRSGWGEQADALASDVAPLGDEGAIALGAAGGTVVSGAEVAASSPRVAERSGGTVGSSTATGDGKASPGVQVCTTTAAALEGSGKGLLVGGSCAWGAATCTTAPTASAARPAVGQTTVLLESSEDAGCMGIIGVAGFGACTADAIAGGSTGMA